jgi:DHA1 family bicyclomycin/chloramphenicol resistance-like MFS transporter
VSWALLPVSAFSFGWSMMAPAVTLLLLDLFPERRGMASSLQSVIASTGNAVVAGLVVPAVMHAALPLALASGVMLLISALAWRWVVRRLPGVYAIAHGA